MKYLGLIFIVSLLSMPVQAEQALQLELVPKTCVTTEQQPTCALKLRLSLRGGNNQTLCVLLPQQARQCRPHLAKMTSEFMLEVQTVQNAPIHITNEQGQILQQTALQIVRYQSPSKRHKRGYVWSLL